MSTLLKLFLQLQSGYCVFMSLLTILKDYFILNISENRMRCYNSLFRSYTSGKSRSRSYYTILERVWRIQTGEWANQDKDTRCNTGQQYRVTKTPSSYHVRYLSISLKIEIINDRPSKNRVRDWRDL